MKQSWQFFGVEIEGGWKDITKILPFFRPDGSVRVPSYLDSYYIRDINDYNNQSEFQKVLTRARIQKQKIAGEIASPKLKNKKEIKSFILENYPDNVDWSTGLHFHISFDSLLPYAALMTSSFHQQFISMMNKFGDDNGYSDTETEYNFWNRFKGNNSYAQKQFSPLPFLATKYRLLNYQSFTQDRRTFECRAFPAFQKKEVSVKAAESFLKLVEDFLKNWAEPSDPEIVKNISILKGYLKAGEVLNK